MIKGIASREEETHKVDHEILNRIVRVEAHKELSAEALIKIYAFYCYAEKFVGLMLCRISNYFPIYTKIHEANLNKLSAI